MTDTARTLAYVLGGVYLLIGIVGYFLTGFSGWVSTEGPTLLGFEINPLHNLVHVLVGVALLGGAAASSAALRGVAWTIAVVYAAVGIIGFFLIGTQWNILALNVPDNFLHLATAALLIYVAASTRRPVAVEHR